MAAGTPAGTSIANTATATFDLPGGGSGSVSSNTVSVRVDELLDVSVASRDGGDVTAVNGSSNQLLTFAVTNAGNGSEGFQLTARDTLGGDGFDPSVTAIAIDANGNGTYDPGIDTVYTAGSSLVLAADETRAVFVLSSIPAGTADGARGRVDLVAVAATGSGAPGTSFAGQGEGGGDAVVGATGADGEDQGHYVVSAATVAFVKSATVADPFGGSETVPGSIITYRLVATVSGSGSLSNLRIADPIPAGTAYEANSLTLGGAVLSDVADGDAGESGSNGIAVRLGTMAAGSSRTVTFKVKVN